MAAPVVFVHGLWLHADSWGPWIEHYTAAGYEARAPGWPGDADTVAETDKATAVTDLKEFPSRGHSLTIDSGWQEVADAALDWLRGHSL
jgi:hypothetical protein